MSIDYFNLRGAVFGAIPIIESRNYLNVLQEKGDSKDVYPHVWKKNHTPMDNFFSIQDKALKMIYNFSIKIIESIKII